MVRGRDLFLVIILALVLTQCGRDNSVGKSSVTDVVAPSVPALITTSTATAQIGLAWTASTDASGVAGYKIYRNGHISEVRTDIINARHTPHSVHTILL